MQSIQNIEKEVLLRGIAGARRLGPRSFRKRSNCTDAKYAACVKELDSRATSMGGEKCFNS